MKRWRILFSGEVQGVGFRHTAARKAHEAGVTGWVRNLPTGQVELVAEGEISQLDQLVRNVCDAMRGRVARYDVETSPATGEFEGFGVRY